ncbi:MAG TPA: sigma 54-interacting transcriptional regulator [Isosphaeraceae bacterium]|jgi:DNA-binding NtrC family response regulator|nr:sigma 54-interacting transcriptional regulator [Isosphaeraceae bacterium]
MSQTPATRASGVRSLLQQAREPVFVLSPQRRLVFVNRAWEELTGFAAKDVEKVVCLPHGPSRAGDLAGLGGSFCPPPEAMAGQPCGVTTLVVHAGGERRWRRLEFWPLHDDDGALHCLVGLVRPSGSAPNLPDAESQRLRAELLEVRERLIQRHGPDTLIGRGPAHRRLLDQVAAAAATTVPVLIVGEPGTGKRTLARAIHQQGPRASATLLPLDCSALPPEVLDRRLFGTTNGDGRQSARLDLPEGSTLILTEVLDLPRDVQARLAEALGRGPRLVATTSGDPERARLDDRLRPDLYFALTTLVLRTRPLRERLDELPLLALHLLERANLRGERSRGGFTPEAIEALASYDWPGNLRELARVVDRAHAAGDGDLVTVDEVPAEIRGNLGAAHLPPPAPPPLTPLDDLLHQFERHLIEQALQRARQNKSRAAKLLNISRPRLYHRIKELNIPDEAEHAEEAPP